ncbi:hypothetical protein [Saccharopolyspora shandongensis]|uniref:hypothetical protein n=1 Tax=Saccharopolyspora shandongensis TaxID=418495 RepID=UPI0015A54097|nr:hypothetical protein [Saccharopolyspora shandongensis]
MATRATDRVRPADRLGLSRFLVRLPFVVANGAGLIVDVRQDGLTGAWASGRLLRLAR